MKAALMLQRSGFPVPQAAHSLLLTAKGTEHLLSLTVDVPSSLKLEAESKFISHAWLRELSELHHRECSLLFYTSLIQKKKKFKKFKK